MSGREQSPTSVTHLEGYDSFSSRFLAYVPTDWHPAGTQEVVIRPCPLSVWLVGDPDPIQNGFALAANDVGAPSNS